MTYENVTGPGQYDKVNDSMFGRKHSISVFRNAPSCSMGKKLFSPVLSPETRGMVKSPTMDIVPSPAEY